MGPRDQRGPKFKPEKMLTGPIIATLGERCQLKNGLRDELNLPQRNPMPEGTAFAPPELTNPPRLSPALLSEHPLILDPLLAQVTGNPDNAIILNQLYYWSQ